MRVGVLASGSGTNLQALLDAADIDVVAVASDKPEARALERAAAAGVASRVFPRNAFADREARDLAMAGWLAEQGVELVVSAGYMQLLSPAFLARFPDRVINVHPALLPAFPGLDGIGDALAYGVKVTGVTVHLVDDGVDTGPVLAQAPVEVRPGDTVDELHERIKTEERRLLVGTVAALARGGATVSGREVTIP